MTADAFCATKIKINLFCIILVIFFSSLFYLFNKYQRFLTDDAFFGGDTWEYQSLGVNLSLGHGYQAGGIEKFDTYKFGAGQYDEISNVAPHEVTKTFYEYFKEEHWPSFNRSPGYPFFLAFIYRIFGIHPKIVKIIQIVLLAIAASLLPIIGRYYWSQYGALAGVLSSYIFIRYNSGYPADIMVETLLLFSLFVWVFFLMLWETRPSMLKTFLLGIVSAAILLIKGTTIFVGILFLLYLIVRLKKIKEKLKFSLLFFIAFIIVISSWSVYATKRRGSFVVTDTQPINALFDGNNEDTLGTGGPSQQWRKEHAGDQKYLYNRLENNGYSFIKKYLFFMHLHINRIPEFFLRKLISVFKEQNLAIYFCMFLYGCIILYKKLTKSQHNTPEIIPAFFIIYLLNLILISLILYGDYRYAVPFLPFFILPAVYFTIRFIVLLNSCLDAQSHN